MLYRYWKAARCAGFGSNVSFAARKTDARESAASSHARRMRRIVEMIVLPPFVSASTSVRAPFYRVRGRFILL